MLIDHFNKDKFKNQKLASAIEALLRLESDFQMAPRSNDAFGGILITMMQTFREDAAAIADLIGAQVPKPKVTQPVVFVDRHKATLAAGEPGCATCGKSGKSISSATEIPATKKQSATIPNEGESTPSNIREVLNMFSSDMGQMRAYAKANGIKYSSNMSAEDLAKNILNYLNEISE